jgi:hypothetical protein
LWSNTATRRRWERGRRRRSGLSGAGIGSARRLHTRTADRNDRTVIRIVVVAGSGRRLVLAGLDPVLVARLAVGILDLGLILLVLGLILRFGVVALRGFSGRLVAGAVGNPAAVRGELLRRISGADRRLPVWLIAAILDTISRRNTGTERRCTS